MSSRFREHHSAGGLAPFRYAQSTALPSEDRAWDEGRVGYGMQIPDNVCVSCVKKVIADSIPNTIGGSRFLAARPARACLKAC